MKSTVGVPSSYMTGSMPRGCLTAQWNEAMAVRLGKYATAIGPNDACPGPSVLASF